MNPDFPRPLAAPPAPVIRPVLAGLAAAALGGALLKLFPSLELTVFAGSAARLAGCLTGSPVRWVGDGWALPSAGVPIVVTTACSATDFFLLVSALVGWQLARQGRSLRFAVFAASVAALPLAIAVNALRVAAVAQAHHWVIPLLPANWGPFLHLLTGVAVFLPSLVALNFLLEHHGHHRRSTGP